MSLHHEVRLDLSSGARLTIHYFSDRELRWIFAHRYTGPRGSESLPGVVNDVRLVADYVDGILAARIALSMDVVAPARLGQVWFLGADVSPGARLFVELGYERAGAEYRLAEVRRGAGPPVRLDDLRPALVRAVEVPVPVLDRIPVEDRVRVPFLRDDGDLAYFELPTSTLRVGAGTAPALSGGGS